MVEKRTKEKTQKTVTFWIRVGSMEDDPAISFERQRKNWLEFTIMHTDTPHSAERMLQFIDEQEA